MVNCIFMVVTIMKNRKQSKVMIIAIRARSLEMEIYPLIKTLLEKIPVKVEDPLFIHLKLSDLLGNFLIRWVIGDIVPSSRFPGGIVPRDVPKLNPKAMEVIKMLMTARLKRKIGSHLNKSCLHLKRKGTAELAKTFRRIVTC